MIEEVSAYSDYRIAGLRVRMKTFGRTLVQAQPYWIESADDADMVIQSHPHELQSRQPHLSLDTCEYLSTGSSFYRQLLSYNGMLLHASAVIMDGYAYVFSAPCGTGKSTHTALWLETFGEERACILNDDKPALRRLDDGWYAYGTPWSGKSDLNQNTYAPLGGVCILEQGKTNIIEPASGKQAIFALLEQTARPWNNTARSQLLELIGHLLAEVPIWRMHCTPTPDAPLMSHRAMSDAVKKRN